MNNDDKQDLMLAAMEVMRIACASMVDCSNCPCNRWCGWATPKEWY